jgi:hypothetical protein
VRAKSAPTAPVLREQAQQDGGSGSRKHHDEDRAFDRDTEEGEIRKVPTWHTNDYGVDLVGSPVVLSQEARNSASSVRIEVTSQIQQGTIVSVEIDHEGDGRIDWTVTVPPSDDFTNHEWRVDEGVSSDGIFYLRKSGDGRAVVARLRASRF